MTTMRAVKMIKSPSWADFLAANSGSGQCGLNQDSVKLDKDYRSISPILPAVRLTYLIYINSKLSDQGILECMSNFIDKLVANRETFTIFVDTNASNASITEIIKRLQLESALVDMAVLREKSEWKTIEHQFRQLLETHHSSESAPKNNQKISDFEAVVDCLYLDWVCREHNHDVSYKLKLDGDLYERVLQCREILTSAQQNANKSDLLLRHALQSMVGKVPDSLLLDFIRSAAIANLYLRAGLTASGEVNKEGQSVVVADDQPRSLRVRSVGSLSQSATLFSQDLAAKRTEAKAALVAPPVPNR